MRPDSTNADRTKERPTKQDAGLTYAFRRLHDDETALAAHLTQMRDQHRTEHEIHHVTRDLLNWSHDNLARIMDVAAKQQIRLNAESDTKTPKPSGPSPYTVVDGQPAPALRLLEDLRTTYLLASASSLSWELLAQYAQARHESDILELAGNCHPRTLRQMRWANTMLKTQSPQALTSL
jgi:hypothetical protein